MSGFDIQRLKGIAPTAPLSSRQEAMAGKSAHQKDVAGNASPKTAGVAVEVTNKTAGDGPPVDSDRVAEIRSALRDGSYPLVPTKIADAMIAARLSMGIGS